MTAGFQDLFVGREAETALLSEKLSATVNGDGQVVLVSGEAGIGKTRLLRRLEEEAEYQKASVHVGAPFQGITSAVFTPILSAILATDGNISLASEQNHKMPAAH